MNLTAPPLYFHKIQLWTERKDTTEIDELFIHSEEEEVVVCGALGSFGQWITFGSLFCLKPPRPTTSLMAVPTKTQRHILAAWKVLDVGDFAFHRDLFYFRPRPLICHLLCQCCMFRKRHCPRWSLPVSTWKNWGDMFFSIYAAQFRSTVLPPTLRPFQEI